MVHAFGTIVGPVRLRVNGDSVNGDYRMMVVPRPIDGRINGILKDGLIEGTISYIAYSKKTGNLYVLCFSNNIVWAISRDGTVKHLQEPGYREITMGLRLLPNSQGQIASPFSQRRSLYLRVLKEQDQEDYQCRMNKP